MLKAPAFVEAKLDQTRFKPPAVLALPPSLVPTGSHQLPSARRPAGAGGWLLGPLRGPATRGPSTWSGRSSAMKSWQGASLSEWSMVSCLEVLEVGDSVVG